MRDNCAELVGQHADVARHLLPATFIHLEGLEKMKIRSLFKMPMAAVIGMLIIGGIINIADAAIVDTKDSADFTNKDFEGNSVPVPIIFGNTSHWAVDGSGNYVINQNPPAGDGAGGETGHFKSAIGWTAEIRLKLDATNLDGGLETIGMFLADDAAIAGHWQHIGFSHSNGDLDMVDQMATGAPSFHTATDAFVFHTIRFAVEGAGESNEIKLWVDDALVTTPAGETGAIDRAAFGDDGGRVVDGTAIVDYFRWDTSGAFAPCGGAPCTVPEPSTLVLLGFGLVGLFASWRRRK